MKKLWIFLMIAAVCRISGGNIVDKFDNADFEYGKRSWNVPDDFSIVRQGRNATNALYVNRPQGMLPGDKPVTRIIRLEHGKTYRISCWLKANITKRGKYRTAGSFVLRFCDKNGKTMHWVYPHGLIESADWTLLEQVFSMYPGSDYCEIMMDLFHGYCGEIWFDSLRIMEHDQNSVYAIAPAPLVLNEKEPAVLAGAINTCGNLPENCVIYGELSGKNGNLSASGKVVKGLAKLNFPAGKSGNYQLKLTLKQGKKVLDSSEVAVKISAKPPRVGVGIDRILRVNGKKFMPIGMYIGQCPPDEMAMLRDNGFNCVMPYGSMSLNEKYRFDGVGRETPRDRYTGDENNSIASIRQALDSIASHGLMVAFNLANMYPGGYYDNIVWQGVTGRDRIVEKAVNSFKDHPALLMWYICDEMPAAKRQLLIDRRKAIFEMDPDHPAWLVTMHYTELPAYVNTCDIMGTDPYPLNKLDSDLNPLEFAGDSVKKLQMPHILVGQAFSWAYYEPVEKLADPASWARFRTPNAEELRTMYLSHVIDGATGFINYYLPAITNPNIPIPDYREKFMANLKHANAAVKSIEAWILSGNPIVMLEVEALKGRPRAAVLTDENGRRCVVISGGAPGNEGKFKIDGEFESMYGKTVKKDEFWHFTSDKISSDILIEKR